jgi:hypothetical protein
MLALPRQLRLHCQWMPTRHAGALTELPSATPLMPLGRREPPRELPSAPSAPRLHARFSELRKRRWLRRSTPAQLSALCTDGCAGGTCIDGHARTFVPAAILAATAPTVANPYTNAAGGTAAGTVGVVGGAAGAIVAPNDITPAAAGAAAAGGEPPTDGNVQGARGHFTPRTFTEEELLGADPRLQQLTGADRRLLGIFGDTVHLNDGTHLDSGIGVTVTQQIVDKQGHQQPMT